MNKQKTGQTGIHITTIISLANMSATATYVVWLTTIFHENKHIFVQHFASWPTG